MLLPGRCTGFLRETEISRARLEGVSGARFARFCCSVSAPDVVCGMLQAFRTCHCEHACCRDASMHR